MPADRYGLPLSTASDEARDAYVEGSDLALRFYPGAAPAYQRAIAADPGFALAHVGLAQVLMRQGEVAPAREALAVANTLTGGVTEREASHIAFFEQAFSGNTDAAITTLHAHLATWPLDALVLATAANPNGLIGASGRIGQKRQIAVLMDGLAPHYGDDYWFLAYHAMALSEDGQLLAARRKIEQSVSANPDNAHAAHGFAHVCYESGEAEASREFLSRWLATYPRDGFFHGHLSWHLSLVELQLGNWTSAIRLYRDAIALDRHSGGPQQKVSDATAFLWRAELAGHPRDEDAWQAMRDYANEALPRPGSGLADLHVVLVQGVAGDDATLEARIGQMHAMARDGRYPSGSFLPDVARGFVAFERGDYDTAVDVLGPLAEQSERIGGSRAQHDLIEFTLLKACVESGRLEKAQHLLQRRRTGSAGVPVHGISALH